MRHAALSLALSIFVSVPAFAQEFASQKVTESDYATLRKLDYAKALFEARKMFARRDPTKIAAAQAEYDKAVKASGWTDEKKDAVEQALGEVCGAMRSVRDGDLSEADAKDFYAAANASTVAVAKAHCTEMENADDSSKAEAQARQEMADERAGDAPTAAQLTGTWILDIDATIDLMGEGLVTGDARNEVKKQIAATLGTASYTFGPGDAIVVRTSPGGKEKVEKGTYRLDGRKVFFKEAGGKREHELDIGMRKGLLQMGKGFGMSVFRKK